MKKIQHKAFIVISFLLLIGCSYTSTPGGFVYELEVLPDSAGGKIRVTCEGTEKTKAINFDINQLGNIISLATTRKLLDKGGDAKDATETQAFIASMLEAQKAASGSSGTTSFLGIDKCAELSK